MSDFSVAHVPSRVSDRFSAAFIVPKPERDINRSQLKPARSYQDKQL